ncbi:MAG: hypothetical protein ABL985_19285 [Casimicrobium sp.]
MNAIFRIEHRLLLAIHADLDRHHRFAAERVGFIACRIAKLPAGFLVLAQSYHGVSDDDYEDDPYVGAMMGAGAIRKALQFAYNHRVAMFHVHRHDHRGAPSFSRVDLRESAKFVPDFWNVQPSSPHGAIVLSHDALCGKWWNPQSRQASEIDEFAVLGREITTFHRGQYEPE